MMSVGGYFLRFFLGLSLARLQGLSTLLKKLRFMIDCRFLWCLKVVLSLLSPSRYFFPYIRSIQKTYLSFVDGRLATR